MLRKNEVIPLTSSRSFHETLKKRGINQIFRVAQFRISPHFPVGELVQLHSKSFLHAGWVRHFRTKEIHFPAAADHLLNQINRFGGTTPARRIKRFVREESQAHQLGKRAEKA